MLANPILLQMKYARVVELFARRAGLSISEALRFFYHSDVYHEMSNGIADMHCLGDEYLADSLVLELRDV